MMVVAKGGSKAGPMYQCREHGLRARVATVEFKLRNPSVEEEEGGGDKGVVERDEPNVQV